MGRDQRDTGPTSRRGIHGNSYTLRAQNGKTVSSSKGKREVLVKQYRKPGTSTTNVAFDAEFHEEINAWAEANVGAPEREDRG